MTHHADPGESGRGTAEHLMELVDGYLSTQLLYIAAELTVADIMEDRTMTTAQLADRLDLPGVRLHRILRGLASIGVLAETPPDSFALTPMGDLLRADHARSLRGAVLVRGQIYYDAMGVLLESLPASVPAFERLHHAPFFQHLEQFPQAAAAFQSSMSSRSRREAAAVAAGFPFGPYQRIVDVGGGDGTLLGRILAATPTARGILMDVPGTVMAATEQLERVAPAGSWEVVGGDFFVDVPPGADLYLLSRVLHDWSDHDASRILSSCRRAMTGSSRLLVIEAPLPDRAVEQPAAIRMDLHMLALFEGGRERTVAEYGRLFDGVGLQLIRTVPLATSGVALLEVLPAVR